MSEECSTVSIFSGARELMRSRVRKIEYERKHGFAVSGIAVKCQHVGCDDAVFVNDEADMDRFERGELFCSKCKASDFYALPFEEQSRRIRENLAFLGDLAKGIRSVSPKPLDALIEACNEKAQRERALTPPKFQPFQENLPY